jgi:ubiquinone/menaquinone biosynthesis C-methylase UbiE
MSQLSSGCRMPLEEWMDLNRNQTFTNPDLKRFVSPFPPVELMANVSGLQKEQDFAVHGTDIYRALTAASSKPLSEFSSILDFGCGCGRLARMFKGHPGRIAGCDIDARHVDWINSNLDFMEAKLSKVTPPIPYKDNEFEAIISISIFTHLTEKSQDQFLSELQRVCMPEGRLFLTVHGKRALERALNEPTILAMLAMDSHRFERAQQEFAENRHAFVLQFGHLTTKHENASERERIRDTQSGLKKMVEEPFEYGITFVPEEYLRSHWGKWFDIVDYYYGGIHDFQDIVVLKPKK